MVLIHTSVPSIRYVPYISGYPWPPRARILAQVGEVDAALDEVERLVNGPAWLSTHTLRLDPLWDPIRKHPRFIALLATQPERSPP